MRSRYSTLSLAVSLSLLAGCASAPGGGVVPPASQATVQADAAKVQWFLQAAGCLASTGAAAAAPTLQATGDAKGNAILAAVGAGGAILCSTTVPVAAVAPAS